MPVLDRCDTDPARTERSGGCTAWLPDAAGTPAPARGVPLVLLMWHAGGTDRSVPTATKGTCLVRRDWSALRGACVHNHGDVGKTGHHEEPITVELAASTCVAAQSSVGHARH